MGWLAKEPYNDLKEIKCPRCTSTDWRQTRYEVWRCRKCGQWFDIVTVDGHHEAKAISPPVTPKGSRDQTPAPHA